MVEGVRKDGHHDGGERDGVGDGHDEGDGVSADGDHVVIEEAVEEMPNQKFELRLGGMRDRRLRPRQQCEDRSFGLREDALAAKHRAPS